MKSLSVVAAVVAAVLVFSAVPSAFANDMTAVLIPSINSAHATFISDYVIEMSYPAGSSIAQDLSGRNEYRFTVAGTPESTENGIANAIVAFNRAFLAAQSPVHVENLKITYFGKVEGLASSALISYRIQADVELDNFVLGHDQGSDILDLEFRSLEVKDPMVLNTDIGQIDISRPIGLLEAKYPAAAAKISASQASEIFQEPIVDFGKFSQPMRTWHFLFDPTGSLVEAQGFEEIGGAKAVSIWSLGESSFREGTFEEERRNVSATIGGAQTTIQSIVSRPSGQIQIAGFATVVDYGGETAYVSPEQRGGGGSDFTLQVLLILGGMMGAIAVFILWKARK